MTYFCNAVILLSNGSMVRGMHFRDSALQAFWMDPVGCDSNWLPAGVERVLYRKLQMLGAAHSLQDLRVPPGNHLEKLHGSRKGQYSIRVNSQWRLCFIWEDGEARRVEFCDYH